MNRSIIIWILIASWFPYCNPRDISKEDVPSIVLNALEARFPGESRVEWEKHAGMFEAEIEINDSTELTTQIDRSGNIVRQKKMFP